MAEAQVEHEATVKMIKRASKKRKVTEALTDTNGHGGELTGDEPIKKKSKKDKKSRKSMACLEEVKDAQDPEEEETKLTVSVASAVH